MVRAQPGPTLDLDRCPAWAGVDVINRQEWQRPRLAQNFGGEGCDRAVAPDHAEAAVQAGADALLVGTALMRDPSLLRALRQVAG